jgi:acyl-coenzyme A thioesterase PaaI-like protein
MAMTPRRLRRVLRWWPPFVFSGIRVLEIADDWSSARIELRRRWYTANYVGTHFGGSLFAMTDPFWMIMLLQRIGPGYLVWDQSAEIRFVKPGRGTVVAEFRLEDAVVEQLRAAAEGGDKVLHWFEMDVTDPAGDVVAQVRKQVYVRKKRPATP